MELPDLCMGCMAEKGEASRCPQCGWDEKAAPQSPLHLPPRTVLNEKYLIGRVLGQGGFGITYLAWDLNLNLKLAIKEYLPQDLASRAVGHSQVTAYTGSAGGEFEYGLEKFLQEARTLAQFEGHPNIVSVRDFFRANGTAYLVMSYVEGMTLKDYVAGQGNRLPFDRAMGIIMPVLDALNEVHAVNILHRDISPDNIFINRKGQVMLIDFGAARQAVSAKGRSLSIILKPGFTPEEQYRSKGVQGPWTDLYAVAATMYRIITGQMPPESLDRLAQDTLVPPSRLGVKSGANEEQALLKALAVRAEDRFQTITAFQEALLGNITLSQTAAVPPSGANWHISRDGARFGPYTWEQMVQMAAAGNIGPRDLVWNGGMSSWQAAARVQGLMPAAAYHSSRSRQQPVSISQQPAPIAQQPPSGQQLAPVQPAPASQQQPRQPAGAPRKKVPALLIGGIAAALILVTVLVVLLARGTGGRAVPAAPDIPGSIAGNTGGNITSGGLAALQGDYIYYRSNDGGKLYKMKSDGSEAAVVTGDSGWYINVVDNWLYYSNRDDGDKICKVGLDGAGWTCLNDDSSSFVNVAGDWIYYINESAGYVIYKMRTDGSERQPLSDFEAWYLNMAGDWLYFVISDQYNNIYKMRSDGSGLTRLNESCSCCVVVAGEWIYYSNEDDGSTVYRMRSDGSEQVRLNDDQAWNLNVAGEWIYYSNGSDAARPYRMRLDGSERVILNEDGAGLMNIVGDSIIYVNRNDDLIYIMHANGSGSSRLDFSAESRPEWWYDVLSLQFYESPLLDNYPIDWQPGYASRFSASDACYIYFVLSLAHPAVVDDLTMPAAFYYYNPDGTVLAAHDFSVPFEAGETGTEVFGYFGWDQPGEWLPGIYYAEVWLDDALAVEGYFEME